MNERIKELILEADRKCSETRGVYDLILAELIVRECLNKVRLRQKFAVEDDDNASHAFDLLVYDLESYFGVEE